MPVFGWSDNTCRSNGVLAFPILLFICLETYYFGTLFFLFALLVDLAASDSSTPLLISIPVAVVFCPSSDSPWAMDLECEGWTLLHFKRPGVAVLAHSYGHSDGEQQ
jgi:hypothetical protein